MVKNISINITCKVILGLLIPFLLTCKEKEILFNNLELRDSIYYYNGELFNGLAKEYYPSGSLKSEKFFNRGQQNGISRTYFENKQKMQEIKPIGNQGGFLVLTWHRNGQMSSRTLLKNNIANDVEFELWDSTGNKVESSFQEWLLFLKSQGKDFGFIPQEEDSNKIRSSIRDSLLTK